MKKICTFSLEGNDYFSKDYRDKLRVFAYILYDLVYSYYGDEQIPLNINKNIVFNNLHCEGTNGSYFFDSDVFDNGCTNYEPFLIGERSFGFTIHDDLISEKELMNLVNQALYMLKIDRKVSLRTVEYFSKDINDEKNRKKAITIAYNKLGCNPPQRKFSFLTKRVIYDYNCIVSDKYPEFEKEFSRKKVLNNCYKCSSGMAALER